MPSDPVPLRVELLDATGRVPDSDLHWISDHLSRAMHLLRAAGEVRVRIVDDAEMSRAHEEFTGIPGTTDVLTFDFNDPEETPVFPVLDAAKFGLESPVKGIVFGVDSDILICVDEAERSAQRGAAGAYACRDELLLYAVHGVLHCLGQDDADPASASQMHALEDAVLRAIGVGEVYSRIPDRDTTG